MIGIIILAIALSLDALSVGIVYAIKEIRIPLFSKMSICFFSMVYSLVALLVGNKITRFLSPLTAKYLGITLLLFMGLGIIIQAFLKKPSLKTEAEKSESETLIKIVFKSLGVTIMVTRDPLAFDLDHSGSISSLEALMLGLALSVDAIGVSIGSALTGFHSLFIPISIGLFQLIFIYLGTYLGNKIGCCWKYDQKILSLLPGLMLIFLALTRI